MLPASALTYTTSRVDALSIVPKARRIRNPDSMNSRIMTMVAALLVWPGLFATWGQDNAPDAPIRQGPRPLKPGEHGVGRFVPDAEFMDLAGKKVSLRDLAKHQSTVIAMTSTSCPVSKKYLPTLAALMKESREDVAWVLVNPVATDKLDEMQAAAKLLNGKATYVQDRDGTLARAVGALTTTDVIVLDAARTVVYHGAIDDQYGLGYSVDAPRHRFLSDALAALAVGKPPLVSATDAPGCVLEVPSTAVAKTEVTFHNRISRIIQQNCLECHRDGGVAPFSLGTIEDVVAHAGTIKQVVERGVMPPWFAAPSKEKADTPPHALWANDRSLAAIEKQDLLAWINGGKPAGDPRAAPRPRQFSDGWKIGKPDAVFEFENPVSIKATGTMPYQNIVVETRLEEDKWVRAIEVQPGDRSVVHHVLVFAEGAAESDGESRDEAAEGRGGFWAIYVPGNSTQVFPEGFAKRLPKGAKLRFQMHYTPNGTATTDLSRIGVIYAQHPPRHEVRVAGIVNARISIPPGAENHREEATLRVPVDVQVMGFLPHMHLRGKACRYEVVHSGGEASMLLDIPRYDFNWQLLYRYFEPLPLKRGDTIKFTAWFDNSSNNPANPDPTKTVRWGPQTFDEMHLGYVEYFVPGAKPGDTPSLNVGRGLVGAGRLGNGIEAIFKRLDRNSDGKLVGDEIPEGRREALMRLDTDKDGAINLEEAKKLTNLRDR